MFLTRRPLPLLPCLCPVLVVLDEVRAVQVLLGLPGVVVRAVALPGQQVLDLGQRHMADVKPGRSILIKHVTTILTFPFLILLSRTLSTMYSSSAMVVAGKKFKFWLRWWMTLFVGKWGSVFFARTFAVLQQPVCLFWLLPWPALPTVDANARESKSFFSWMLESGEGRGKCC